MDGEAAGAIKIFYCYAREDQALRDKLDKYLVPMKRSGRISPWYDRLIQPGGEWQREIEVRLNSADVVLLLVTPDFISSDYCYGVEVRRALERHAAGETQVIPIILRPSLWKETMIGKEATIGKLQALPKDGRPVTQWEDHDKAFQDVAEGIRVVVGKLLAPRSIKLGDEHDAAGRYDEALEAYEQAIEHDSKNAQAYYSTGKTLNTLGRYSEALVACNRAIEYDSHSTLAQVYKSHSLYGLKRYDVALDACEQALRLDPENAQAYGSKGRILYALKRYDEALVACKRAIRLAPNFTLAYAYKGVHRTPSSNMMKRWLPVNRLFNLIQALL